MADPQVPGAGDAAAVRLLRPGQQCQQGALADPVAPNDSYALTCLYPGRYAVQEQPLPVALDHLLQVDQVHACSAVSVTTAAPGAGPTTWATVRQTPAPARAAARSR